ncbi:MAG TPA: thioredoxin family protein [Methanospirillum sp.]|nr:thioredoxin family protein [Methanospirillum sp.]HOJ96340.1 thioredoxin family protein [Methanospirillum sp.]HOL40852.1 thioredoxin family protein [Methanospirillum sp.]HPP76914.1 thioredoxin family protein [Methanospirillum sp.]
MPQDILPEITDSDWEIFVERNEKPVFVMFYSPSCTHCIRIMPSVEELAKDFGSEVTFVKLNLLRFDYIGERYGVMATPTFFFFCGGKPVQSRVGAVFPAMLKKMVEEMVTHGDECRLASSDWKYEITGYG